MALVDSATQISPHSVTTWSWAQVYAALTKAPAGKLWGVPRGGQIVAGLTGRAVDTPDEADVIVDDIRDSGRTAARYQALFPEKPFWTLTTKDQGASWVVFPWEGQDTTSDIEATVVRQLEWVGETPTREGLAETPRRVVATLYELTRGYTEDPSNILATQFTEPCDAMVLVRDLRFFSLCEHHMLPFHGTVTVGYVPRAHRVVGLSKIARLVQCFARRLQVQERLTWQIAQALDTHLNPLGVGVLIQGEHLCMQMRGVRNVGKMQTSCVLGVMREKDDARAEFLHLASM